MVGKVGLVLVSHSRQVAEGVADLVAQVAGDGVTIVAVGGGSAGELGTDGARVLAALRSAADGDGAVVLMDLGSTVFAVRNALQELADSANGRVLAADAPLVEGAIAAGVAASTGAGLAEVVHAAEQVRTARKLPPSSPA